MRVAEPRPDQAQGCCAQDREIEQRGDRRLRGQRGLEAAPGERRGRGHVAVHRRRGREHGISPTALEGQVLGEVVDRAGADRDQAVREARALRQLRNRAQVGLRLLDHHRIDRRDPRERPCHPAAERLPGVRIAHEREPRAERERRDEIRFAAVERGLDRDPPDRQAQGPAACGLAPAPAEQIVDRGTGGHAPHLRRRGELVKIRSTKRSTEESNRRHIRSEPDGLSPCELF